MCNCFIQKDYFLEVDSLDIHSCICPFCKNKSLIFYGFYERRIRIPDSTEFEKFEIHRIRCKHCNQTHALLPDLNYSSGTRNVWKTQESGCDCSLF